MWISLSPSLVTEVSANVYWRSPFSSLYNPKQLTEYTVLETDMSNDRGMYAMKSKVSDIYHTLAGARSVQKCNLALTSKVSSVCSIV